MADIQRYREQAASLRDEANEMRELDVAQQLLEIARLYDKLAANIEKRGEPPGHSES
jgi:hypothetical protein